MKAKKLLTNKEIASFCGQVALIFNAGITPAEGMSILLSDTANSEGKEIIEQIHQKCCEGSSFCDAIKCTEVFPDYVVNMIHMGEESGNLDNVMQSLSDYYEREENIAESIKSAISYPIIMIGMMLLVIIVLLTKVLPIFDQVFNQLGSEMQGVSKSLMNIAVVIRQYSVVIIVILCVAVLLFLFFKKTNPGKRMLYSFLHKFPLTRGFYESVAAGRFASGMALMLSSGVDTYSSLDLVKVLVGNKPMEDKITKCKELIEQGSNFSEAIASAGIFSNLYCKMISVGFRAGSVDVVMRKIADNFEKETDNRIHSIISILEPTLVIILSVIVGLILLSVILPLMGIMSSIG